MKIAIIGDFSYPDGSAAASRIRHIAKGVSENGHDVRVISMLPRKVEVAAEGEGWVDCAGIPCLYAAGHRTGAMRRSRVRHAWALLRGLWRAMRRTTLEIEQLHASGRLDGIILYSGHWTLTRRLMSLCRRLGITVVADVVEWHDTDSFRWLPFNFQFWDWSSYFNRIVPRASGVIAISKCLADHYRGLGLPVVRVPAIIDPPAEPLAGEASISGDGLFHVTYLGDLAARDNPEVILEAIRRLRRGGQPVFLDIVGTAGRSGAAQKARLGVETDPLLHDCVRFWGRVSDAEVRERLVASDALLFSRKSGRAAQAAFPTRLPEFLVTGRPVISSAVGDIPEYLQDGQDAILVRPDDAESLAAGICRVMNEPDRGRRIGLNGFRKCHEHFHYRKRAREIGAFLEEVDMQRLTAPSVRHS